MAMLRSLSAPFLSIASEAEYCRRTQMHTIPLAISARECELRRHLRLALDWPLVHARMPGPVIRNFCAEGLIKWQTLSGQIVAIPTMGPSLVLTRAVTVDLITCASLLAILLCHRILHVCDVSRSYKRWRGDCDGGAWQSILSRSDVTYYYYRL